METIDSLCRSRFSDIRANPRPDDLADALVRVRQNPTEFIRAFSHKDNAELGRLLAHEVSNALMARAQREARELAAKMGVTT